MLRAWRSSLCVGTPEGPIPTLPWVLALYCSPRGTLYRKDRNKLVYPDPLPGLTHEFIEAAAGIK